MSPPLTPAQADLLRAIDARRVAWRRHRLSPAVRRTDVRSKGRGGALGRDVTAAAHRLRDRGLAFEGPPITDGDPARRGDRPWHLTVDGRLALAAIAARARRNGVTP
jgi:hypothetical protein